MKYFLVELVTKADTGVIEKAVYEYNDRDSAVASFHKKFGANMDAAIYSANMDMVIDEKGSVIIYDYFAKAVSQPQE